MAEQKPTVLTPQQRLAIGKFTKFFTQEATDIAIPGDQGINKDSLTFFLDSDGNVLARAEFNEVAPAMKLAMSRPKSLVWNMSGTCAGSES